jgi:aspartyl protease family protein
VKTGAHEMVLTQGEGGGFYVIGKVNGAPVRFVIDTGASDIVLTPDDARRAGADMAALDYRHSYETANGVGAGAPFIAEHFEVGAIKARDVPMSVNGTPMSASLLGGVFLRELDSYEVKGNRMTLRWHG